MAAADSRRGDPNSPYWVRMRAFERTLLRNALVFSDGTLEGAARTLGMPVKYVITRAGELGGVVDGSVANEPYAWKTWSRRKRQADAEHRDELPSSDEEHPDLGDSTDDDDGETYSDDDPEDGDLVADDQP